MLNYHDVEWPKMSRTTIALNTVVESIRTQYAGCEKSCMSHDGQRPSTSRDH
jgi:hypothetical protein